MTLFKTSSRNAKIYLIAFLVTILSTSLLSAQAADESLPFTIEVQEGACVPDPSATATWLPYITNNALLTTQGSSDSIEMDLSWLSGDDGCGGIVNPAGQISSTFTIDDPNGKVTVTGSSCDNTPCDAASTNLIYGGFDIALDAVAGTYNGTFAVTWTP